MKLRENLTCFTELQHNRRLILKLWYVADPILYKSNNRKKQTLGEPNKTLYLLGVLPWVLYERGPWTQQYQPQY